MKKMRRKFFYSISIFFIALFCIGSDCDHGLKPRFTAVEGDLVIEGDWPEEAVLCFIVTTVEKPDVLVLDQDLLKGYYQIPDEAMHENMDSIHFEYEINAGTYGWTFVAILDSAAIKDPENGLGWRNLAAEYFEEGDSSQVGTLTIGEDDRPYVRMLIDFDHPYWDGVPTHSRFQLEN